MLSSIDASHFFAGEDVNQHQREECDASGDQNDIEHTGAPERVAPGYEVRAALNFESDSTAAA